MATNLLAVAPGGIAEMSLTAMTIGADPLLVSAFQLFRVLFVLSLFSLGVRTWLKRHPEVMEAANSLNSVAQIKTCVLHSRTTQVFFTSSRI